VARKVNARTDRLSRPAIMRFQSRYYLLPQ
jgi:hypothetical protein